MDIDQKEDKKSKLTDYTKVTAEIDAAVASAKQGSIHAALDQLLGIEKQQRLAEDVTGTKKACTAILDLLFNAKEWKLLNEHILLLNKRRSQLKQVVQAFVKQSMGYIEKTPDKETKVELIKTLQTVTEGKIFVEIERARLTKKLAKIKEDEGDISEAAAILQEVAVETYGAMAKTEKIAYILEQVRLCLVKGDFVRAQIMSRKITPGAFRAVKKGEGAGEVGIEGTTIETAEEGTPDLETLKKMFYELKIQHSAHGDDYPEMARSYMAMLKDISDESADGPWVPLLKKLIWCSILSPIGSGRTDLLNLSTELNGKRLDLLSAYKKLLETFLNFEIIWRWKIQEEYQSEINAETDIFGGEKGAKRQEDLETRITQHNIEVVSRYYSQISVKRLSVLLDLPEEKTEEALCNLSTSSEKKLYVKIDRPSGIINFKARDSAESRINEWSENINHLLSVLEKSCQQIQKEAMVHKVAIGKA